MITGLVLAGGVGRRMGGVDKARLRVAGLPLLDRVLAAARPLCDQLVVVGPERPTGVGGVVFVTEAQPGGGPVPAVLAGLEASAGCDVALVMATDLPLLGTAHLHRLLAPLEPSGADAAAAGRSAPNPLLAAYRGPALLGRAAGLGPGSRAGLLLPPGTVAVDLGAAALNVNRPEDLDAAELLVTHDREVADTAQWLRQLVATAVPDAVESVYSGWHGFGYRHRQAGYFCAVLPRSGDVKLSFEHGGRLPDPRRLLRGRGHQVRHVDVHGPDDPPAEVLVELVDAAVDLRASQAPATGKW